MMELPFGDSIETPANLRWLLNRAIRAAEGDGLLPKADRENDAILVVPWDADIESDCTISKRIRTTLREEHDLNAFTLSDVSEILDERNTNATLGDAIRAIAHVSNSVFVLCTEETIGPQTLSPHTKAILEDFSRESGVPQYVWDRAWILCWEDEGRPPTHHLPEGWFGTQQVVSDDPGDDYRDVYAHIVQHTEDCLRKLDGRTAGEYWYGK